MKNKYISIFFELVIFFFSFSLFLIIVSSDVSAATCDDWFSCQEYTGGKYNSCNAGSKGVFYQQCVNYSCSLGNHGAYSCGYQHSKYYCKGCGISIGNAVETGCGGEGATYECYSGEEWVLSTCRYSCVNYGVLGYRCQNNMAPCQSSAGCPTYKCSVLQPVRVNEIRGRTVSRSCCVTGSPPVLCNPNDCCTPPACSSGYTATPNNCSPTEVSCSNSADCSQFCSQNGHSNTRKCYPEETNIKPPSPASITIGIDNWESPISTNPNSRTLIKYPFPTSLTLTKIPSISKPATARDIGAKISINGGTEHKTTGGNFTVNNQPVNTTLKQGDPGTIIAKNYTLNKCDNGELDSDPLTGYYKVNTLPIVDPNAGGAEIDGDGIKNPYGCTPEERHTGKIDNNELTITVKGTDPDGNSSINGVVVWLAKESENITSSLNELTYVEPGIANVNPNQIGLFIAQDGTVYKANNSGGTLSGWGRDTQDNPAGTKVVSDVSRNVLISDVRLVDGYPQRIGDETIFAIKLTFPEDSPIDGSYQLYAGMTDNLSYVLLPNGTTSLDQRSTKKITGQTWTFDFINPTVETTVTSYDDEAKRQLIKLEWKSRDNSNDIPGSNTVVNIYKNNASPVNLGNTSIDVTSIPTDEEIGLLSSLESGWIDSEAGGGDRSVDINIRENDKGNFFLYVTTYDRACNRSNRNGESVSLNKWIATKGGLFFSQGVISFPTKDVAGNDYNLGTELIFIHDNLGSFFNSINDIRIVDAEKMPALARDMRNRSNEGGLYDKLSSNLKEKMEGGELGEIDSSSLDNIICNSPDGCYLRLEGNQELPNDIKYSGKIVIYSEGDIQIGDKIEPTESNEDVMYIFSEGNISIGGEQNSDINTSLAVDSIDAFLMARGKVTIERGTQDDLDAQDQVEVTGGIIAFGEGATLSTAISLQRSLGTLNLSQPALVVNYHPKYSVESSKFFGSWYGIYKREVGFKPG